MTDTFLQHGGDTFVQDQWCRGCRRQCRGCRCWCSGCRSLEGLDRAAKGLASALPGVKEREAWSKTTFRVAGRLVLTLAPDGISATRTAALDNQAALVATDPGTFAAAAYLGRYGWVTVRVDRGGPDELEYLVVDAWRQCAPRRLAEQRLAGQPSPSGGHRGDSPL